MDRDRIGGVGFIVIACGLLTPLRGCVAALIAKDGMYADFAGAKICPCPNSALGVICEPGALRSNPPFRRLNKKGHLKGAWQNRGWRDK